ncbi:hypothetical protein RH831_10550 [Halodesulfurarchaeum sp. HSR-GB]|uniref:hypothetical protein n=1 Tax=Halodesulfurarchaeum sp. HSR-GB TaxID=3074077 RepID=UPI00285EBC0D|nr:hypothetical protein [Halodesulfurarchaeum sp. HSR-GB]MDR5657616.1 hypothetical protein [Halodesulfurarchaeum sp. HSR-GB]
MWSRVQQSVQSLFGEDPPDETWGDLNKPQREDLPDRLVKLRPRRTNPGVKRGPDLAKHLHGYKSGKWPFSNASDESSFELWYEDGELEIIFAPGGQSSTDRFQRSIETLYSRTATRPSNRVWPSIPENYYLRGATTSFEEKFFLPIARVQELKTDPLDTIGNAIAVDALEATHGIIDGSEARFVFQLMLKPASDVWAKRPPFGIDMESVAETYKNKKYKGGASRLFGDKSGNIDPSADDIRIARVLKDQFGQPGFYIKIRLVAATPDPTATSNYFRRVENALTALDNPYSQQSISAEIQKESRLGKLIHNMIARDMGLSLTDRMGERKMMATTDELASILHLPTDGNITAIDWATMDQGYGVPEDLPGFWDVVDDTEFESAMKQDLLELTGVNP